MSIALIVSGCGNCDGKENTNTYLTNAQQQYLPHIRYLRAQLYLTIHMLTDYRYICRE